MYVWVGEYLAILGHAGTNVKGHLISNILKIFNQSDRPFFVLIFWKVDKWFLVDFSMSLKSELFFSTGCNPKLESPAYHDI